MLLVNLQSNASDPLSSSILALNKPSGFTTHATDAERPGLLEIISQQLKMELIPIHRLDQGTSGCLLAATSRKAAAQAARHFKEGRAQKTYDFLSHQLNTELSAPVEVKLMDEQQEAITTVKYIGPVGSYHHYQANPKTGRTHQIRKAAQSLGISILGDNLYGGKPYFRLALHSSRVELPGLGAWQSPLPSYFLTNPLCDWFMAIERRKGFLDLDTTSNCLRMIHNDGGDLRMDRYGDVATFYWYGNPDRLSLLADDFDKLTEKAGAQHWWARAMIDRGADASPNSYLMSSENAPTSWIIQENNIHYQMQSNRGLSFGLFLDQKSNRKWVKAQAHQKRVLNLFCYTGGFSLAALAGGASAVESVDVSKSYGEWVKENISHNTMDLQKHRFYAMDAREYLTWAQKKQKSFDLIILDPPSFGRSAKGVFRLEKDSDELLRSIYKLLSPGGQLLFTCNFERWTGDHLKKIISSSWPANSFKWIAVPWSTFDYELPGEPAILKTVISQLNDER